MDLKKILASVENHEELIKQIESEIGKEFVPRTEFNAKNTELKERDKLLGELKSSHDALANEKAEYDKTLADLTGKYSSEKLLNLKTKIARENNIPYELAGRLTGDDEATLLKDAESLSKLVAQKPIVPPLKSTEPVGDGGKDAEYKALLDGLKIEGGQ